MATPLPPSTLYTLKSTANSGRGVFATQPIPTGTHILTTASSSSSSSSKSECTSTTIDSSPLAWLIQRPYRKEVCATCFLYDRGREFKLRHPTRDCGVVFYTLSCRDAWIAWNGDLGVQAWEALEASVKGILKRNGRATPANGILADGHRVSDSDSDTDGDIVPSNPDLSEEDIAQAWTDAKLIGDVIVTARGKAKPSKTERKVLSNVLDRGGDPDLMFYLLTAVIQTYRSSTITDTDVNSGCETDSLLSIPEQTQTTSLLPSTSTTETATETNRSILTLPPLHPLSPLNSLTPTLTAYNSTHTSLPLYTTSYQTLLSLLPLPLLQHLTPSLAHTLNTRAAHNAFSIRPPSSMDGSDSGEFLGWGVWPAASFFNHSCRPNVGKRRVGRDFLFAIIGASTSLSGGEGNSVGEGVDAGEELCISYLGGEEKYLGWKERRERLMAEWGFECCCVRCVRESGEEGRNEMNEMKEGRCEGRQLIDRQYGME